MAKKKENIEEPLEKQLCGAAQQNISQELIFTQAYKNANK